MVLSRLDIVKDFIDYLTGEFNKEVYKILREDKLSPKKIMTSWEWRNKESFKTIESSYDFIVDECFLDEIIDEWEKESYFQEGYEVKRGAEQVAILFSDEVYKISSNDVGTVINQFINSIDYHFRFLFLPCSFEGFYKGCYIYKQDRVEVSECSGEFTSKAKSKNIDYIYMKNFAIDSDDCCAAIVMKYGQDFLKELCDELGVCGYTLDIHYRNFGITENGDVRIFDPIYQDGDY